jgi:hypothetical protein
MQNPVRSRRSVCRNPLLAGLLGLGVLLLHTARAESLLAGVPTDWWSQAQSSLAAQEYEVSWTEAATIPGLGACWQAPNRAHGLRTYFSPAGPRVAPRTEDTPSWTWGLELVGFGFAEGDRVPAPPTITTTSAKGNRIEFVRSAGLTEWYVNDAKGLEQGFTVATPPPLGAAGADGTALVIDLAVRGSLIPGMMPDGQTVEFLTPGGAGVMRYGGLCCTDAENRQLPAELWLDPTQDGSGSARIRIVVHTTAAVYPLTIDPLVSAAAWTAESNQVDARFGTRVATAGDVNSDGYSDVIVGAPLYDNGQADEGRAFVYLGGASGLSASPAWTAESNQAGAEFGCTVAPAGDVNGDGYSDIIVGAYRYDSGQTDEGAAFLWYGSASGLGANGTPANADWMVESDQASASMAYGVAEAAGDVNGDGHSDIIVGAHGYDNGQTDKGAVFVWCGSATGLGPNGTPANADWMAEGTQVGGMLGFSGGSAGDVNGDGYGDVIAGTYMYDNGETNEGAAFVWFGSATGLGPSGTPANAGWMAEGNQASGAFAYHAATVGDVNGDGYSDVGVAAPDYDNGATDEGMVFVWYGSAAGLGPNGTPANADWTAESNQASAFLGTSVACAGDVNGDGYSDLIVGAYKYDKGEADEGTAYVWYGSATGLGPSGTPANAAWTAECNLPSSWFGWSVACAGDVNGDGYSDVIVGAPWYTNGQSTEGRTYLYYGGPSVPSNTAVWVSEVNQADAQYGISVSTAGDVNGDGYADVLVGASQYDNGLTDGGAVFLFCGSATGLSASPSWTAEGEQAGAGLGNCVASAGDVNGDGYDDIIVGASGYDNGQTDEGAAFVWYGSATGLGASGTPANADWKAEGN